MPKTIGNSRIVYIANESFIANIGGVELADLVRRRQVPRPLSIRPVPRRKPLLERVEVSNSERRRRR